MSAAHGTVAVATMAVDLFEAAQGYLEARDELTSAKDAYEAEITGTHDAYFAEQERLLELLTSAEEREALALARLRAKVAAW